MPQNGLEGGDDVGQCFDRSRNEEKAALFKEFLSETPIRKLSPSEMVKPED